jgi:hypothetical protein
MEKKNSDPLEDYPKDERCKFCINRWHCHYEENGICPREGEK